MLIGMNGQQLLQSGTHKVCACQRTLIPSDADCCRACQAKAMRSEANQSRETATAAPPASPRSRKTVWKPSSGSPLRIGDAVIPDQMAGGFAALPERTAIFAAAGVAVPQGSMAAAAKGVIKRSNATELLAWRKAVHQALMMISGHRDWANADCPMRLHVVFTAPKPDQWGILGAHTAPADPEQAYLPRVAPSKRPDLDKLLRAVGDALAPKSKPGAYTDDGRIVEMLSAQTFPFPEHVHPWALGVPGVVIRVCPADVVAPFPPLTLTDPGPQPPELVAAVDEQLLMSRVPLEMLKAG